MTDQPSIWARIFGRRYEDLDGCIVLMWRGKRWEHAFLRKAVMRSSTLVPHPAAARVQKALALVESEPDTIGLHSAACELREALRTLGVLGPVEPSSKPVTHEGE